MTPRPAGHRFVTLLGCVVLAGVLVRCETESLDAFADSVVAMPEVRAAFKAISVDPRSSTPDEYRALIARDAARWKAVAAAANIKLE